MNIQVNLEVEDTATTKINVVNDLGFTVDEWEMKEEDEKIEIVQDWISENYTENDPSWFVDSIE